ISDLEEKLQKFTEVHDNETSVKIILDDTLEKATPIIKYNANITDKLIESGYLSHNDADKFAVQIALLTITEEVVGQLVSSFTAEPAEID
nr:hypothetical protein [Thiomicrorhabdus sp.]